MVEMIFTNSEGEHFLFSKSGDRVFVSSSEHGVSRSITFDDLYELFDTLFKDCKE